jgi:hypothetical protein
MGPLRSIITTLLTIGILAAAPFVLLRLARFYFEVVEPYRKRKGHVVSYFGGREPGDGISVTYYEGDKELHFFSDRDERIFYIPDEDLWDRTMPDFFRSRQSLIVQRLMPRIPKRVSVKFVNTYPADRSILYVDQSKTGPERVLNIGKTA